ncbi:major royal jelly protein 2-like isoform X1 [Anthonomus grandis grandis]|uniref:major royal jelly protein 2-like isoform X1 n=1 Tax=Anthonomus grandis grandis TaxID=2921223 RepID=UPI0021658F8D|nr:major royal jelly protein 2-like isoform X1 [Anthonomus grandis grandis]
MLSILENMYGIFFIAFFIPIYAMKDETNEYNFKLLHQWHRVEFQYPSEAERTQAIKNGSYAIDILRPLDAQYTYHLKTQQDRYFITVPRRQLKGTPATLGVINTTEQGRHETHVMDPYPSWSWHMDIEKCNYHRIVNIYRIWADECSRLWVMDNAKINDEFICPPQILVFDLEEDTLLFKYELPYDQYQNVSYYVTPIAEVESMEDNCKKTWLYVADPTGPRLLVYNLEKNISWTIQDESFKPDPNYDNYTIEGDSFQIADGILSLALSPKSDPPGERKLFYHAMSNIRESWVYLKYLKNPDNFKEPYGSPELFYTYPTTRDQQSPVEAIDSKGIVYFALLIDVLLVKWDPTTAYTTENFVVIGNNKTTMQFPTCIKVMHNRPNGSEYLLVFPTSYQKYPKPLDKDKVNFWLFRTEL